MRAMLLPKVSAVLLCCVSFQQAVAQEGSTELLVQITDMATGLPTEARVRITDTHGELVEVPEVGIGVMYGRNDTAEGFAFQPDGAFYADGSFAMNMAPGTYLMTVTKGFEYLPKTIEFILSQGSHRTQLVALERWINMPQRGWYSADDHIHIRRSPRENPYILKWIAAEDVHVGALLRMGDFWATYYEQYAFGEAGLYEQGERILTPGQEEPRTHEIGHTISLAADEAVRFQRQYYLYDRVFDRVHDLNGLTGYAHQGELFHGYRGMTMDVLGDKIDFLELLQFCTPEGPVHTDHYYFFLNLGFKLTATAGSDFPWCGRWPDEEAGVSQRFAQIGNARFYTHVGDEFSFENWKANFKAGHTFVSSGPMLDLRVNDALPGDTLAVSKGDKLHITVKAYGHTDQVPLNKLELVAHGEVLKTVSVKDPGQSTEEISIEWELPAQQGIWIAARCEAGPMQTAHTTPVYISVDGGGFHNSDTVSDNLDTCEMNLNEIEAEISQPDDRMNYHAWRYKEALQKRITKTREIIDELRTKLN